MMRFTGWCILWAGILSPAMSSPGPELYVEESATECQRKEESLFCDFKNAAQDTVYMKALTKNIKKVFIHNVKKLNIREPVCVNVDLYKVNEVNVTAGNDECPKKIEFMAKTTSLNRIPGGISNLILEQCEVDFVMTKFSLFKFNIIKSNIKVVELQDSFVNGTDAEIRESKISNLSKLVVGSGSRLLIDKSTVNITQDKGLDISGGKVTIQDSLVIAPEGSLSLSSGDSLMLKNQQGLDMAITADPCTCSTVEILLYICFALLVISWILIGILLFRWRDVFCSHSTCRRNSTDSPNNRPETDALLENKPSKELKMTANDIKKDYKSELNEYLKKDGDHQKELEDLQNDLKEQQGQAYVEKISNVISLRLDKFSDRYKYLDSLKKKEVTIASSLASEIWKFDEDDRKQTEAELKKNIESDSYIREYKNLHNKYVSSLKVMCALLKAKNREEYQDELCQPKENIIKYSQELAEKFKKDTKLETAVFSIIDDFEIISLDIFHGLQKHIGTEVRKNIEQRARLLKYMFGTLPFKSKDKKTGENQSFEKNSLSESDVGNVQQVFK